MEIISLCVILFIFSHQVYVFVKNEKRSAELYATLAVVNVLLLCYICVSFQELVGRFFFFVFGVATIE